MFTITITITIHRKL